MPITIPFKITVCGIDELPAHGEVGVSHVLSILDPDWPVPDAFGSFGEHERLELRFHDLIEEVPGMIAPQPKHVDQLLASGRDLMAEPLQGAHLLVHCHAGVSRSTASLILMIVQACPRAAASAVVQELLRIRPQAWPNLRIIEIGDAMLGRNGEIIEGVKAIYRVQLGRRPELAEAMTLGGRNREIVAGSS
jgi:predicted protein tyrosine phosphatase